MAGDFTTVEVDGRQVRISNPAKVFFSARDETKLDLVHHYLTVGPGALRGVWCRPTVLHRFPDGAEGKSFYQKRSHRAAQQPSCAPPIWPTSSGR